MVNSTKSGGGVAEILSRMIPMLEELGMSVRWEVIEGTEPYYRVTKKFHNALHGRAETFTPDMFDLFADVGRRNMEKLSLRDEVVFIHDPQPITLVDSRPRWPLTRWIWRCHIDVSSPAPVVWRFLQPFILRYDTAIYSAPAFVQRMGVRQVLVAPSIDALSEKNRDMDPEEAQSILRRLGVPTDRPILTQVSRFDYLKDPIGVIDAYRRVRRTHRCRLVLAGGPAHDDPESAEVLAMVQEEAAKDPDIHVLMLPPNSDLEINALQRASAVVIQKSLKEGFALTVSEALWKGRPVVASAVGGIPLQVKHGLTGLLVQSVEGAAEAIRHLLDHPEEASRMGERGREHVRRNFLLTRHVREYLLTFLAAGQSEPLRFA
jgi:trehalose synthase